MNQLSQMAIQTYKILKETETRPCVKVISNSTEYSTIVI